MTEDSKLAAAVHTDESSRVNSTSKFIQLDSVLCKKANCVSSERTQHVECLRTEVLNNNANKVTNETSCESRAACKAEQPPLIDRPKVEKATDESKHERTTQRNKQIGKCKWFNILKGWGFITPEDGKEDDVFVHQSVIHMPGFRGLTVGQQVCFESKLTPRGLEAVTVTMIDNATSERKRSKVKQSRKIRCYNCGEFTTHLASECDQSPQPKKCHHCKSEDHLIVDCPLRVAFLLLDDEESDTVKPSELNEEQTFKEAENNELLNDKSVDGESQMEKLAHEQKLPSNIAVVPSVEQDANQNAQDTSNRPVDKATTTRLPNESLPKTNEQAKGSFLNKTTKSLMNYKKLTKKIKKKQTSTSSLSNASFSSSSSEISTSSISSQSVSPCSFTCSNQQTNYQFNDCTQDAYSIDQTNGMGQTFVNNNNIHNQLFSNQLINEQQLMTNTFAQPNYIQDQSNSYSFYDQSTDSYLPVMSPAYRFNQPAYSFNQFNPPYKTFVAGLNSSSHHHNLPFKSGANFKVCSSYDFNGDMPVVTSHLAPNPDYGAMEHLNYLNNYSNQLTFPVSSQTPLLNKQFVYPQPSSVCLSDSSGGAAAALASNNPMRTCNCITNAAATTTTPANHLDQLSCEDKLVRSLNHSCLDCRTSREHRQFMGSCHHQLNCYCTAGSHRSCCKQLNNSCENICRLNVCSNETFDHRCMKQQQNCMNHNFTNHDCHFDHHPLHHHHHQITETNCHQLDSNCKWNCCRYSTVQNNFDVVDCGQSKNCRTTKACSNQKKVFEQFETDSGVASRCNSTANGSLDIE